MDIWIGLAHVIPNPGNESLAGAAGAFVPALALALAEDDNDYACKVTVLLQEYDFQVLEIEDIECFEKRQKQSDVDQDICELASHLSSENPVALSTFDAYDTE